MTALLRAAALTHFEQVASECGLDARQLVAEVGLPERCLREPDLTISALQTCTLLELAAERAREPAFGLRMAATRRLSNLGPLGLLLRDQPTLRHALEDAWCDARVNPCWQRFALQLDASLIERLLQERAARG